MEWLTLKAELRDQCGTRKVRRLRKKRLVPAVLYGHKKDAQLLILPQKELSGVLSKGIRLVNLTLPWGIEKAFVKEIQINPVNDEILHIDFTRIVVDEAISVEVEIHLKGQAKGVTAEGGMLTQNLHRLQIKCLPEKIPARIEYDITELGLGGVVRVKDLVLPEGVTTLVDPEVVVVAVHLPKVEEAVPAAAEVTATEPEVITAKKEEPEEGEEAPPKAHPGGVTPRKDTAKG